MALVAALGPVAKVETGRLAYIAGDPIGGGSLSGVIEAKPGWVLANGATLSNTGRFAALFAMLSTKFGASGTLPNFLDGRVPIPKGATNFPTVGASGGELAHVVTLAEFPSHIHSYVDALANLNGGTNQANIDAFNPWDLTQATRTSAGAGSGGSHNNMPPFQVVGFVLVKL